MPDSMSGDGVGLLDRAEEFGDGEAGGQADGYGDGEQRDERLEPDLDDQEEQQGDAEGGDGQQTGGAVDEGEQAAGVRWGLGGGVAASERWDMGGPLLECMGLSGRGDRGTAPRGAGAVPCAYGAACGSAVSRRGSGGVSPGRRARRSR